MDFFQKPFINILAIFVLFGFHASLRADTKVSPYRQMGTTQNSPKVDRQLKESFDQSCGISCPYSRAQEVISTQALYYQKKLETLKEHEQDSDFDDYVLENLKDFCLKQETGKECFDRYVLIDQERSKDLRGSMISNEKMIKELEAGTAVRQNNRPLAQVRPFNFLEQQNGKRKPIVTQIKSYTELQVQSAQEHGTLTVLTSEEYRNWVKNIPKEPSRDDFLKLKKRAEINQAPVDSDQLLEFDTSCGKQFCYDEQAYEQAVIQYRLDRVKFEQMEAKMLSETPVAPRLKEQLKDASRINKNAYNDTYRKISGELQKIQAQQKSNEGVSSQEKDIYITVHPNTVYDPKSETTK